MKTIKTIICGALLLLAFILLLGECDTMVHQLTNFVIGCGILVLDTYLWQWWKMDKYYDKFLED